MAGCKHWNKSYRNGLGTVTSFMGLWRYRVHVGDKIPCSGFGKSGIDAKRKADRCMRIARPGTHGWECTNGLGNLRKYGFDRKTGKLSKSSGWCSVSHGKLEGLIVC